mgnify:CR=1 FL=1
MKLLNLQYKMFLLKVEMILKKDTEEKFTIQNVPIKISTHL